MQALFEQALAYIKSMPSEGNKPVMQPNPASLNFQMNKN